MSQFEKQSCNFWPTATNWNKKCKSLSLCL